MDKCHCAEYKEAVKNLRFYSVGAVGAFRHIDNYDRKNHTVIWQSKQIDVLNMTFEKPRVVRIYELEEAPRDQLSEEARKIDQMWCQTMYNRVE